MKNQTNTVEMMVTSGQKILVPATENVRLKDGRRVHITKVTPFKKLIRSRLVEGQSFEIRKLEGQVVCDYSKQWRLLGVAQDYQEALPVSEEHRRCLFCGKPVCTFIVWSYSRQLDYELQSEGFFVYGSLCRKYNLEYLNVRNCSSFIKAKADIPATECPICTSPNIKKATDASDIGLFSDSTGMVKIKDESHLYSWAKQFMNDIYSMEKVVGSLARKSLYKCGNCSFIFDSLTNLGYFLSERIVEYENTPFFKEWGKIISEVVHSGTLGKTYEHKYKLVFKK